MPEHRIVSLLPSTTEIACALGFEAALVGRSHECDFPASVRSLPVCTRARFEEGTSRQIDDRVKALVGRGLSVYDVDAALLRELAPTHVLTQDQCEACAVSLPDVEAALADWTGHPVEVVSLSPATLGDVWSDIARVGSVLGCEDRARRLGRELASRVSEIGERTGELGARPGVACIEWIDPPMAAGHWMPELVRVAGGDALFGRAGQNSEWLEWDALREADPDRMLVLPCGFDLARTRRELPALRALPGFEALRCVREGGVALADGNAFFNRPGPRLVESLEILAEVLHPGRFDFGHRGRHWEPLHWEPLHGEPL